MARSTRGTRSTTVDLAQTLTAQDLPIGTLRTPGVLITFRDDESQAGAVRAMKDSFGAKAVAFASDFAGAAPDIADAGGDVMVFDSLGVAVASVDPDQASHIAALGNGESAILSIEPEPVFFAFGVPASDYWQGYRDGVDDVTGRIATQRQSTSTSGQFAPIQSTYADSDAASWGLSAIEVLQARATGRGVKVAILDTGLSLDHIDFRGRTIVTKTFVGQPVDDLNGHGTHCAGTACGSRQPQRGPRYGIASGADIFVGKVLTNQGSELARSSLAGIEWARQNGCHIVSMSLGARVGRGAKHLTAFETAARRALRAGTLIIAAAGNDSRRSQDDIRPVSHPANCPSIMAVGALDANLQPADFSNGAVNEDGKVDIAGPGVSVLSSAPDPAPPRQPPFFRQWQPYCDTISGTSMATPHVTGVAALLKEEFPDLSAGDLWRLLVSKAKSLPHPASDVGAGLLRYS